MSGTTLTHGRITITNINTINFVENSESLSGTLIHLMEEHHTRVGSVAGTEAAIKTTDGLISDGAERLRRQGSRLQTSRLACFQCCGNFLTYLIRLRSTPEELEQRYKSKEIDKCLEKDRHTFRRQYS
ncbi:hypothetical protein M5D96_009468 [Drosophila gunungcola]|uniref:Uncharacterized protein n=1 Tax=Drosophila gunungcola TaxID=103775 RepID=A0A9P9YJA3_9MUSC|nr:hypothetical protein M5D96_009468 [Drosophila gunungcola]